MSVYRVQVGQEAVDVSFDEDGSVLIDGQSVALGLRHVRGCMYEVTLDGEQISVVVRKSADAYEALIDGVAQSVSVETRRSALIKKFGRASNGTHRRLEIRAPMPALVVRVEVRAGDEVETGNGLVVLEAMKMENELRAHSRAKVKEVYVTAGKAVEKGALLMLLE
jgi:pyruvate carboxylase subunit B